MSRFRAFNGVAAGTVVALTALWGLWVELGDAPPAVLSTEPAAPTGAADEADGDRGARRIASCTTRGDQILVRLVPREEIAAVTAISAANDPVTYSGLPVIPSLDDVEAILSVQPDLVIVSGFFDPRRIARLEEAGLRVVDLGPLDDLEGFLDDVRQLGRVVGREGRAEELARSFLARMRQVAADVPDEARPRGMYLAPFGGKLYGGARGTSYHDVLVHGGLVDAAEAFEGWPELDPETVLEIDPSVLVTTAGMGTALCRHVGLEALTACGPTGRIVEVEAEHLGDPGLGMLPAAETIRRGVHGPPHPPE